MKKLFGLLTLLALLFAVFTAVAGAESVEYFYVNSETGNDDASGISADTAVKTFTQACRYAEKSGVEKAYIVITNEYSLPAITTEIAHTVHFVVTTNDGTTDYAAKNGAKFVFEKNLRYILKGDTTFENITIEYTGTLNCVAQYNHITFGENVVTKRLDNEASGLYVVGGWQSPENSFDATLDSHVTIKSGSFLYVIGGSRQRAEGGSGLTLTGTHYITVEGGNIENLLGASAAHNWSKNAVITMSGGYVKNFCVGGDASRRLNGSADVTLTGGEIGTLNVNNVVGNAAINLLGTKVGSVSVSYYNAEIETLAAKAKSKKNLVYDANYYTEAQIDAIEGFNSKKNAAVVYAKDGASGSGLSEDNPASFADAFKLAAQNKAVLTVIGKISIKDFTEPSHGETVFVVGNDTSAAVAVSGTYTLSGETSFDNIKISGKFNADNGNLLIAEKATVSNVTVSGSAHLYTGVFGKITNAKEVIVEGATVESIVGGADKVSVEVHSGKVGTVKTTDTSVKDFNLVVSGGTVDKIIFNNVTDKLSYTLMGGEVKAYEVSGNNTQGSLVLNEKVFSTDALGAAAKLFTEGGEKVFYLADGATGTGMTLGSPSSSLEDAYTVFGENGCTVVVIGKYTVAKTFNTSRNSGKFTFTSVYDGVDYQKTNGAEMIFTQNFYCGGDTEFNNITLRSNANYRSIYANCYNVVFGDNITSYAEDATNTYMSIMGAAQSTVTDKTTNVTINSGIWQRVRGGAAANNNVKLKVNLTVNGGRFIENLTLGSSNSHDGAINATVNGGVFQRGIYASTLSKAEHYFTSDVNLTINGGTFYGNVAPAKLSKGEYHGTYGGSFNVTVNGGSFEHIEDLRGANGLGTMTSTLNISDDVDINAEFTGTYTFTNPIRTNGADPWVFYCDGYYYYTATTGSTVGFARARNLGDLKYADYITIYDPEDGHEWSKNLWSPEIHYYTDAEIGEGNGGWYLFLACDDGDNVNHRMYVVKCLDGDNLMGRWGNPITGEVNMPQRVEAKEIPDFDNTWAAGMSEIRINGKLYMLYITEEGRGTSDIHQTINIVEMTNPWTIVGQSKVICFSEYEWEKGGYAKNATTGTYWPMVVEGSTAVYGEDGSVYIIYSGSGYWTVHYNLAQLKYIGGDPLEITSWEKSPEPILYKSDSINGCGHASYVTDTDGQGWVCYHAYIGKDTTSGRYAFVEPYHADKNGVVIADGAGHPAPIDTEYTVNVNPLPLGKRISGFDKIESAAATTTTVKLTIGSTTAYINGVAQTLDAAPINRNNRTMLPVRFLANAFGVDNDGIKWDAATRTATLSNATTTIVVTIDAPTMTVNGKTVELDSPAIIESDRTYLPVRAIANALGVSNDNITWDAATNTATLVK